MVFREKRYSIFLLSVRDAGLEDAEWLYQYQLSEEKKGSLHMENKKKVKIIWVVLKEFVHVAD